MGAVFRPRLTSLLDLHATGQFILLPLVVVARLIFPARISFFPRWKLNQRAVKRRACVAVAIRGLNVIDSSEFTGRGKVYQGPTLIESSRYAQKSLFWASVSPHLILCYLMNLCYIGQEMEAQRGDTNCPWLHSWEVLQLAFKSRPSDNKVRVHSSSLCYLSLFKVRTQTVGL